MPEPSVTSTELERSDVPMSWANSTRCQLSLPQSGHSTSFNVASFCGLLGTGGEGGFACFGRGTAVPQTGHTVFFSPRGSPHFMQVVIDINGPPARLTQQRDCRHGSRPSMMAAP